LFTGRTGRPLRPDNLTDRFNRLAVAAKVRPIRPHQIRYLIASSLLDAGYGVHEVAERLGHDPATLMRYYTRVSAAGRLHATDRIAELMTLPEGQTRPLRARADETTSLLPDVGTSCGAARRPRPATCMSSRRRLPLPAAAESSSATVAVIPQPFVEVEAAPSIPGNGGRHDSFTRLIYDRGDQGNML
jgi:hypothetical protein